MVGTILDRMTRMPSATGSFVDAGIATAWRDLFPPELLIEEKSEEAVHIIRVEAPDIDPDKDVDIEIKGSVLTLRVERHEPMREDEEGTYCSEFSYGVLSQTIALPDGVLGDVVTATYRDGILEIRMPRAQVVLEARRVPVSRT